VVIGGYWWYGWLWLVMGSYGWFWVVMGGYGCTLGHSCLKVHGGVRLVVCIFWDPLVDKLPGPYRLIDRPRPES
jgi:hypothetical protein